MRYRSAGPETGRERSMTPCINVVIAVAPLMPKPGVSMAETVNTGESRNYRTVKRRTVR